MFGPAEGDGQAEPHVGSPVLALLSSSTSIGNYADWWEVIGPLSERPRCEVLQTLAGLRPAILLLRGRWTVSETISVIKQVQRRSP
jgi:hypothetical protein